MPLAGRVSATIAINQSLSAAVKIDGQRIDVIEMPTAWTAAVLTFQGSNDGVTFYDLWNQTAELSILSGAELIGGK